MYNIAICDDQIICGETLELTLDKKFRQNLNGAKEAGLPVGIYLFCYENNDRYIVRNHNAFSACFLHNKFLRNGELCAA